MAVAQKILTDTSSGGIGGKCPSLSANMVLGISLKSMRKKLKGGGSAKSSEK